MVKKSKVEDDEFWEMYKKAVISRDMMYKEWQKKWQEEEEAKRKVKHGK